MTDTLAIAQLMICLMKELRAYYKRMPADDSARAHEIISALAATTAAVLADCNDPEEGRAWFVDALDQALLANEEDDHRHDYQ